MDNIINNINLRYEEIIKELKTDFQSELNYGEISKYQFEFLQKYGFFIEKQYCQIQDAFFGNYGGEKPGPRIAFLINYNPNNINEFNLSSIVAISCVIILREFINIYGGEIIIFNISSNHIEQSQIEILKAVGFENIDIAIITKPNFENYHIIDNSNSLQVKIYENALNCLNITNIKKQKNSFDNYLSESFKIVPTLYPYFPIYTKNLPFSNEFSNKTYKGLKECTLALVLTVQKLLTDEQLTTNIRLEFNNH